jgi:hypothetical protein
MIKTGNQDYGEAPWPLFQWNHISSWYSMRCGVIPSLDMLQENEFDLVN